MVPVASDGTAFDPLYRRQRGYQIGPKGGEQWYDDYWLALAVVSAMTPPKWRRPNRSGNWGIVTGVDWLEIRRSTIEAVISDPQG